MPVDNSGPQARCLAAGGPGLCPASRSAIIATAGIIEGWLSDGIDLDADILPMIAKRTTHIRISPIRTWAYFTDAVRAAHRARLRAAEAPKEAEKVEKPGTAISPQLRFYADWVNSERYLPPSAITNTIAHALLGARLVSDERLALRGIPFSAERTPQ